jgi:hypothetical protein
MTVVLLITVSKITIFGELGTRAIEATKEVRSF